MPLINKSRLVSLASASALVATMAVASLPAATFAADNHMTGFFRDGRELTAKQIGGVVTGDLDATGYDIGVYNPTSVTNADIHDATYFGVVVNGLINVNTTNSKVYEIGDPVLNGAQHGRAITYINGASGTISGNQVFAFQKNGIEVINLAADGVSPSSVKTSATVQKNVVTGAGPTDLIAQNGIVIRGGASATVNGNALSKLNNTKDATEACGVLILDGGRVTASKNTFSEVELSIYTEGTSKGHVKQ